MRNSLARSNGFILVATIWIMAALVLMVSTFAIWVDRSLDTAYQQNKTNSSAIDAIATQQILLYLLATQDATPAGIVMPNDDVGVGQEVVGMSLDDFLGGANIVVDDMGGKTVSIAGNELRTNDDVYKGVNNALFSLKDMTGFVPLNSPVTQHIERLLQSLDVDEQQARALVMTLQDYVDRDDVIRPNGAEAFQYLRQGLTPPKNLPLRSKYELANIIGWRDIEPLWKNQNVLNKIEAVSTEPYNINAISADMAMIMFNLSESNAQLLVDERKQGAYLSVRDISQRTGLNLNAYWNQLKFYTSEHFRLSFYTADTRLKREINVYFPAQGEHPWIIYSDLTVPFMDTDALAEPQQPQTSLFR
ncbi:general secretion pathway protein GspK [Alteromonas gracilis]|uniref:general secretion pathway protein GspK n=1 Tax=Alteromonas gracilis TaxID=1479524 RepID=UPI002FDF650F